jgi:two-component system nitrate/nitrite response regulator NarL
MTDWLDIPVDALPKAIPEAQRKTLGITPRELQIVQCLAKGMVAKEIAHLLQMSFRTVEIHVREIKLRTGIDTRAGIIITADRLFRGNRP